MIRVLASIVLLLTFTGAPVLAASHFDGADSVITVTDQASLRSLQFTVGCWTRYATLGEASSARFMERNLAWNICVLAGPVYRFIADGWDGSDAAWQISAQGTNTWAHVAVSYDASSTANVPILYLNGVATTRTPVTAPVGTFVSGTSDLTIGNSDGQVRTWDGELGECFFYNRILTALEVMQVKIKGPTSLTTGRVSYWPLGVFGARNYTTTTGLDGVETAITQVGSGPPLGYASQGSVP